MEFERFEQSENRNKKKLASLLSGTDCIKGTQGPGRIIPPIFSNTATRHGSGVFITARRKRRWMNRDIFFSSLTTHRLWIQYSTDSTTGRRTFWFFDFLFFFFFWDNSFVMELLYRWHHCPYAASSTSRPRRFRRRLSVWAFSFLFMLVASNVSIVFVFFRLLRVCDFLSSGYLAGPNWRCKKGTERK